MRRAMSTERDEHVVGGDGKEPGILCNGRRTDSRGAVGEVPLGH
jgi:hypothetical protein